ncbi:MAG: glycoside hydrolase family 97 protein [Flavobacterium sp.]|uniref:glycoside hydrolase family 97 protein n=1 Tax=Flavobacterium sp. TaxID=239 RepID=UPI0012090861|nr:glycoside hydrolase family 97 protein [Flavobacterium sp.]RZJ66385.1 MAG: glycoside hydrolase family 97 protein [Flavobacterium sp.]
MNDRISFLLSFLSFSICVFAQNKSIDATSPDGKIKFSMQAESSGLFYSVAFGNQKILERSNLGLAFNGSDFGRNLKSELKNSGRKTEKYSLVVGKNKNISEDYSDVQIKLTQTQKPFLQVDLHVKIFNDGVAFRYEFPKQKGLENLVIADEMSVFNFVQNPTAYALYRDNYLTSHEGLYTKTKLDSIPKNQLLDMPVLFELDGAFVSITEAALRDYAGMYLSKSDGKSLVSKLSPLPNQTEVKVKASLPHKSPWRVIMISGRVGGLIESNLLTNLNENPTIKDWSWLKTGSTDFTWWNGDVVKDVDFKPGLNFDTHKYLIDFCADSGIDFHSVVSYGSFAWYQGETEGFNPSSPNADVTKPVAALQMEKLADYSHKRGVGLRVWVNWGALYGKLDESFAQFEKWNIKGMMVDFMDRDDQEMVNFVEDVLKTAAKYHMHIQFHGAYKPTGMIRTYPNELTKEGVLNLEVSKWNADVNPEHNLMVPFTRMLAGPMDYHAGGFQSVTREEFKARGEEPTVMGTRCHHLAMPIVYESYLQMICDYPGAYKNQPGFEFLTSVPTNWDDTKVLNAKIGDYLTIARKSGTDWYVGTMNDWTPRELQIDLSFLPDGIFIAEIFEDAPDAANNPNHISQRKIEVTSKSKVVAKLATGGGQAIKITPKK